MIGDQDPDRRVTIFVCATTVITHGSHTSRVLVCDGRSQITRGCDGVAPLECPPALSAREILRCGKLWGCLLIVVVGRPRMKEAFYICRRCGEWGSSQQVVVEKWNVHF